MLKKMLEYNVKTHNMWISVQIMIQWTYSLFQAMYEFRISKQLIELKHLTLHNVSRNVRIQPALSRPIQCHRSLRWMISVIKYSFGKSDQRFADDIFIIRRLKGNSERILVALTESVPQMGLNINKQKLNTWNPLQEIQPMYQ